MSGEIVIGYDGEDGARNALRTAVAIAKAFGRGLTIVFGYAPPAIGGQVADLARSVEALGTTITNEAVAFAHEIDASVPTNVELVNDRPAEAILRAAEACDAFAIVVAAAGHGPVSGTLLGSATYQVVHRSRVPVVVVPLVE